VIFDSHAENEAIEVDPQKERQNIKPYTNIFRKLYPELKAKGFTDDEFKLLVSVNPSKAYAIKLRTVR